MSLSHPHPQRAVHDAPASSSVTSSSPRTTRWEERGLLALVGMGVEPGLSDVFARHATDELFSSIDEIGVRDGANLVVEGYEFAPTFSIWTTIEECLNPPRPLGARPRLVHDRAVQRSRRSSTSRRGSGRSSASTSSTRRSSSCRGGSTPKRVTFKYGLGEEFIGVLRTLHKLGLDSHGTGPRRRRRRCRRATCWPPACPTRPPSATRCTA